MGLSNYYLKARFRSPEEAATAEDRLATLLTQGQQAYRYFQDARRTGQPPVTSDTFWAGFRERFPLVAAYLRGVAGAADWDGGLDPHLACLVDPESGRGEASASLDQADRVLYLRLDLIWDYSDLGLLEQYCRDDLGAVAVGSFSDENFDPFDLIQV